MNLLDLGCGHNRKDGYKGVDIKAGDNVDVVCDLRGPWPFPDNSVDGAYCSHVVEHLQPLERVHFVNELWRVMKHDAEALIITPHWNSGRAYGDMTHVWPPVSEAWFNYLSAPWREEHPDADSSGMYKCFFEVTYQYGVMDIKDASSTAMGQFALRYLRDVAADLCATFTAVKEIAA